MTTVLLCEDEPVLADNIRRALEGVGVEVRHAANATQTRDLLAAERYDLLLADIALGDGDGIDEIARARLVDTPVVVMTGQDSGPNRARAEAISVSAFLPKPFALARLRELVIALTGHGPAHGHAERCGPCIVMYSHDTIGLGHMRRNMSIAQAFVDRVPNASVLMLVGCPNGMMFQPHPGIDYVKLPSLSKIGQDRYQSGSLRLEPAMTVKIRTSLIAGIFDMLCPDVFLVDHEPTGIMDELGPILRRLRQRGDTKIVLGLRDILDAPERLMAAWERSGKRAAIDDFYDRVLIYGNPDFYRSRDAYAMISRTAPPARYCGVVTDAKPVEREVPVRPPRRVLVAGGGGRDAFPLIRAAMSAWELLPEPERPEMTVVTGPLMDGELRDAVLNRAAKLGITAHAHVTRLADQIAQADLLITLTGYNSINEALTLGCPIVTVPRLGPSAEQQIRADRLDKLGLARVLPREALSAEALARLMRETPPPASLAGLSFDGSDRAATILARMVEPATGRAQEAIYAAE